MVTKLTQARAFATRAHQGQLYGGRPYTVHLAEVSRILELRGFSEQLQAAGWLHDTLEDTDTSAREMTKIFGRQITGLVEAVTTPHSIGDRKARLEALIVLIRTRPEALPLKLADRLANSRASQGTRYEAMYRREYPRFREALIDLSTDPKAHALWAELDQILLPKTPA